MKKDSALIRKLLLHIREKASGKGSDPLPVPYFCNVDPDAVECHLRYCEDDGLIVLSKTQPLQDAPEGAIMGIIRITSAGLREIERLADG